MVRFSGGPGRWPAGVPAEENGRQTGRRSRSDRRVESAHDEQPPEIRLREKQNRTVERESEKRRQTVR